MITFFTCPRAFQGEADIHQQNAIRSWQQLRPECEILLVGDDPGVAEAAALLHVRHIPGVRRSSYGTPMIDSVFALAEAHASHPLLCYINTDIIVMPEIMRAVERVQHLGRFVMAGQRWDLPLPELWDFTQPDWETRLRALVVQKGVIHWLWGIDYYVFPRGFWEHIPPFATGRTLTDNWLAYQTRKQGAIFIDATPSVMAIHQDHHYTNIQRAAPNLRKGLESLNNRALVREMPHLYSLLDATHLLLPAYIKPEMMPISYPPGLHPASLDMYRENMRRAFFPAQNSATRISPEMEATYRALIATSYWQEAEEEWKQRHLVPAVENVIRAYRAAPRAYSPGTISRRMWRMARKTLAARPPFR